MVANIYHPWREDTPYPDQIFNPNACIECYKYYSHDCYSCKQREYHESRQFIELLLIFLNNRFGNGNRYLILHIIEQAGLQVHLTSHELIKLIDF